MGERNDRMRQPRGERMLAFTERLNRVLYPYLGPAALGPGPGGERTVVATEPMCPLCATPMASHVIERTADQSTPTRLHCP